MSKVFEELKVRAIEAVMNNDVEKLSKVCDRKEVYMGIASKNDKQENRDILGLSSSTIVLEGREYSLIGLAIKNANPTMIRMLGRLGCNPLMPAYKEKGNPTSVLSYLKQRTEEVKGNWDMFLDMGEANFAIYKNRCLTITPEQMLENFRKHANKQLPDSQLLETIFFYPYNIYECNFEFEVTVGKGKQTETRLYYPLEYLLVNGCRNVLLEKDDIHNYNQNTLIPYHGVDKEKLLRDSNFSSSGDFLIDNKSPNFKGEYPMASVVESVISERKCLQKINQLNFSGPKK